MKKDPIQFMIKHKETIYKAYRLGGGVTQSWRLLKNRLPEIHETMKISTYTTYVSVLTRLLDELNKKTTFEKGNRIQGEVVDKKVKYLGGSTFTFRLSFL